VIGPQPIQCVKRGKGLGDGGRRQGPVPAAAFQNLPCVAALATTKPTSPPRRTSLISEAAEGAGAARVDTTAVPPDTRRRDAMTWRGHPQGRVGPATGPWRQETNVVKACAWVPSYPH
jgi:hypothetical protein